MTECRLLLLLPRMTLGGADRFHLTLLERLRQQGYAVTICAVDDGPNLWHHQFSRCTDDIFILPGLLRLEHSPLFLCDLIESRRIDVVLVSASILGYGLVPYLRSCCPGVTFVDYVHMVDAGWRDGGHARASVNSQPWLDLSITSSQQVKTWMIVQGADADRIEVCSINVDTAKWDPARFDRSALRRALDLPEGIPVILYAARLEPQKQPRLLTEVMTALRKRGQQFTCLVAGDGPEYQWLARCVARHDLQSCVRLLGPVEPEAMPELMAASDIFFLPSRSEGIAATLYEAMAMGLPVVSAHVGGQAELVTPDSGWLVRPGSGEVEAYVEVLGRLIASPPMRIKMGGAGRERVVAHFNIQQMTGRMIALFEHARELSQNRQI